MKTTLILFFFCMLLVACEPASQSEITPEPPVLVQADSMITYSSINGFSAESGICPNRGGRGMIIRWLPVTDAAITEFSIERTSEVFNEVPVSFREIDRFPSISSNRQNEYRDTSIVDLRIPYFYRMRSFSGNVSSGYSNIVSYELRDPVLADYPVNATVVDTLLPELSWNSTDLTQFIIMVRESDTKALVWMYLTNPPSGYASSIQRLRYGATEETNDYHIYTFQFTELKPARLYEWSVMATQTYFVNSQYMFYFSDLNFTITPKGSYSAWEVFKTPN